jgi:hypothetical protein
VTCQPQRHQDHQVLAMAKESGLAIEWFMAIRTDRNQRTTLRRAPRSHKDFLAVAGMVIGLIVAAMVMTFIMDPLVHATRELLVQCVNSIRSAVGEVK